MEYTNSSQENTEQTVLYYDGACGLCSREISTLRKHASKELRLQDIHALTQDEQSDLPPKTDLLTLLHARTADGSWVIGADANVLAWQYTRFGRVFKCLRWPVIRSIVDFIYSKWAVRRYKNNVSKGLYKGSV